jgi:hypothetical protein
MRNDLILDFETIGAKPIRCPAIDISYGVFHWDRFLNQPYTFEELLDRVIVKNKFNIAEQVKVYGAKYSKEDINFWERQSKDVQKNLRPTADDLTVSDFTNKFVDFLKQYGKINYWWSRSNMFDPIVLWRLFDYDGKDLLFGEYLRHGRVRDTRTYIDAKLNFPALNGFVPISDNKYWSETFIAHDSSHDVAADILRLQTIHRIEHDLEQTNR